MRSPYSFINDKAPAVVRRGDAPPTMLVGDDKEPMDGDGDPVMYLVYTRLRIKSAEKEFTAEAALHVVPLLRMLYHDGEVLIDPAWAPGLPRLRAMNKSQLLQHVGYLRGNFTLRTREGGNVDMVERLYGAGRTFCLFEKMKDMLSAWMALEKKTMAKVRPALVTAAGAGKKVPDWQVRIAAYEEMSDREIDDIVRIATPEEDILDDVNIDGIEVQNIVAPTIDADPAAAAPSVVKPGKRDSANTGAQEDSASASGAERVIRRPAPKAVMKTMPQKPTDTGKPERVLADIDLQDANDRDPVQALMEHLTPAFGDQIALEYASLVTEHPDGVPTRLMKKIEGLKPKDVPKLVAAHQAFRAQAGATADA